MKAQRALPMGKLGAALLRELLADTTAANEAQLLDARVLLGPAIGRDAAAIDVGGEQVLVATSDPITFAENEVGWYAVHVNANDIACMGATPAWFLATVLLPPNADEAAARTVFEQIAEAASELKISVVGGHTEVTAAVSQIVVAGTMLGVCLREDLVTGEEIAANDEVVLMGEIAIEGTALLAHEAFESLRAAGVAEDVIDRARRLLHDPGISVVAPAARLRHRVTPRMLHDATEGGVATALYEMAEAAGVRLRIDESAISSRVETGVVCRALGIDPMGLVSSGALIAVVPEGAAADIEGAAVIGKVEAGRGVILESDSAPFPKFERDELARYFDEQGSSYAG